MADVRVTVAGRVLELSLDEALRLRNDLWEQAYPLVRARDKAALDLARSEGRVWVAVFRFWGSTDPETEEYVTRNEALGALWGVRESETGYAIRLIEPDRTTLEGDVLDEACEGLYDESGEYANP